MTKIAKSCLIAAALMALAACDKPAEPGAGPMEKVGRNLDQATERAKAEAGKMGQKIDQAADQAAERAKEQSARAGQVLDDTAITAAVKAGILAEPGLKVLQIDVDTKDGQVTLTGSADSAENVQKATQIASNVNGVKSVQNRLAVSAKG